MLPLLALLGLSTAAWAATSDDVAVFTPEDMLSTPRPQAAIASPDGVNAVSVVDQWDPKKDATTRVVYLLSLNTTVSVPPISLFNTTPSAASDFLWLDATTIAYLNDTTLFALSINYTTQASKPSPPSPSKPVEVVTFPSGVSPTSFQIEPTTGTLGFSGQIWADGNFETTGQQNDAWEGRGNSGWVYDELMVRHWDTWRVPGRVWTLGVTKLGKSDGVWEVQGKGKKGGKKEAFVNVLNGTGLTSQTDPIDASSYSLSSTHIALAVKLPHQNVATHTREDVYLFPLPSTPSATSPASPKHLTAYPHGAINNVVFSPDGKKLAWLEMKKDGYESDRRVVVVYDIKKGKGERWTEEWDRSPSAIIWDLDSVAIFLISEHHGRILPYHLTHPNHLPTPLLFNGSTSSLTPLTNSTILLSRQSLTTPADEWVLTLPEPTDGDHELQGEGGEGDGDKLPKDPLRRLTAWSEEHIAGRLDGFGGEEFWFEGAEGKEVMGWAIKPRGWKEGKEGEYPLAFLIHGGPQGAWEDSWSTRWNPAVYASQGYFVVAINPTGSTGYGQDFTDAISGDWGGKPFKDLLAGYHAALSKYPEIDRERTTALGASYGGYMINWINGHNDHFGFKALVCHDGVFDTVTTYFSTEEVYFPTQDFQGTPLTNRAAYEKWSPVNHAIEWNTPQLVIQGGKDYRLENSQGLGAFTALQTQGIPSRFLYFPDENHWVLKPHNSIKWHYEVLRWLHEWVGKAHEEADLPTEQQQDHAAPFVVQQ
ncbi:hypothetical protein IAT38_002068 [Cryptococcus sp. DSM 104549]